MPNTRDWLYKNFQKRLDTTVPYSAESESINSEMESKINDEGSGLAEGTGFSVDNPHSEPIETTGPLRQIIKKMPTKFQRRVRKFGEMNDRIDALTKTIILNAWNKRPWREKTEIEKEMEAEIKARQKELATLRREAKLFCRRASNSYARMGLCYFPPMHQRNLINGVKKVQFSNVVVERNAIWLQIDTARLPWGVDILRLIRDEGVLTNLSASLRHHVQGKYDVERGAWLCIERGRGVRGIPQNVTFEKMYNLLPAKAHRLTVPFGESVNSTRLYRSLRDMPHLLIAGSTGQGKTSFLNVILATLIKNNTPEDMKLVLVDLKNGIEFTMYKGVPHLWKMGGDDQPEEEQIAPEGIVGRPEKVLMLLKRLKQEGERRLTLFQKLEVTNIDEYNRGKSKSRMSRIVVMIDEWARVALSPEGSQADNLMSEITATYRAVGFHVVLATQTPVRQVISTLIKTNFNARLAFGVPTNVSSMVILDTGRAKGLQPAGRAIFQSGTQVIETQVPYIQKSELIAVLDEARADGGRVEDRFSLQEMLLYSLNNLDGNLPSTRLYEQFKGKIGKTALETKLRSMDGEYFVIDGTEYRVCEPIGNKPRRLEFDDQEIPTPTPA